MSKTRIGGMDQGTATRFLVVGIILAVGFGTLILISSYMVTNADEWAAYEDRVNQDNLDQGLIGPAEFADRAREITRTVLWMEQQQLYFGIIGRVGVNVGMILVIIGFIGFGTNNQMDENTRRACVIIAGVLGLVMMVSFIGSLGIYIGGP
ncbi:MAG: hypothetical protein RBG13Loki_2597 [Promethearchaeota archaeon CR_4]|nr:MAG: hypothetical protein RBG13Loki_2597 [Candidatus Lokiarchaeota archaeon CR_4]